MWRIYSNPDPHGGSSCELLMSDLQLIWTFNEWFTDILMLTNQYKEHMHAHACWNIYVYQHTCRCLHFLPILWISAYLNFQWMIYRQLNNSQSKSSTHTCTFALVFLGILFQTISFHLHIITGAYIAWWPYTIYKSKDIELFLLCNFVYRIKINALIFKIISLLYSFVYNCSSLLPNFVLKFGLLPKKCRIELQK
jgi:hypothetical protein